jgi:hypothetical protein
MLLVGSWGMSSKKFLLGFPLALQLEQTHSSIPLFREGAGLQSLTHQLFCIHVCFLHRYFPTTLPKFKGSDAGTHLPCLSSLAFPFVVSVLVGLEVNLFQTWSLQCYGMTVVCLVFLWHSLSASRFHLVLWHRLFTSRFRLVLWRSFSLPPGQGTHISLLSVNKIIHTSISLSILAVWWKLSIKYYCHMYVHNRSVCWCLCAFQCEVQSNAEAPDY